MNKYTESNLAVLNGDCYPEKAGMLIAEVRYLRCVFKAIIAHLESMPNFADDLNLAAIELRANVAIESTEYIDLYQRGKNK